MGMTMSRMLAVLGLAFSFLLVPAPSFACSCAQMATDGQVKTADVVVRGTVDGRTEAGSDTLVYAVGVDDVFKGSAPREVEVRSAASGAACGLENVALGREYVVFAYSEGGELWANLCGGTAPASPALVDAVQRVTGPPTAPAATTPSVSPEAGHGRGDDAGLANAQGPGGPPPWVWPTGIGALAVVAAAGIGLRLRGGRTA
jgi:hypothetical protein